MNPRDMYSEFEQCDECKIPLLCAQNVECAFEQAERETKGIPYALLYSIPLWIVAIAAFLLGLSL